MKKTKVCKECQGTGFKTIKVTSPLKFDLKTDIPCKKCSIKKEIKHE